MSGYSTASSSISSVTFLVNSKCWTTAWLVAGQFTLGQKLPDWLILLWLPYIKGQWRPQIQLRWLLCPVAELVSEVMLSFLSPSWVGKVVVQSLWKCPIPPESIASCTVVLNMSLIDTVIKTDITARIMWIYTDLHYMGVLPKWTFSASCGQASIVNAFVNASCSILAHHIPILHTYWQLSHC